MITQELVNNYFTYKDGELFHNRNVCNVKKGDKTGSLSGDGYLQVVINRKFYKAHRVIFLMHHGYLPEYLDHIDLNKKNNKIENLRPCSAYENNCNTRIQKRNTSGVKGVSWHKKNKNWYVRIAVHGKVKNLGSFVNVEDARQAIEKYRKEVHGNFANNG